MKLADMMTAHRGSTATMIKTEEELVEICKEQGIDNKSALIRYLLEEGHSVNNIAHTLWQCGILKEGSRRQFVYNVKEKWENKKN